MYPVAANFHTLAIQDAPKTRVRIYFIGDGVDCTDDNDVQTNGTLLVGAAGDTDSNGRISESGITFSEYFNPEKNIMIGDCVSSQISMTLLNYDGALDGFAFGRCKVYLDVYDNANSAWLPCPMGVYLIEQPRKTRIKLVSVHGFDQMQKLDAIADSWWNGIDWSGGLTWDDILASMAASVGLSVISNPTFGVTNFDIVYTSEPFKCAQTTYREVLKLIGEFACGNAFFDRDGKLGIGWFFPATYPTPGTTYTIDADSIGNTCLSIDTAEYTVPQIASIAFFDAQNQSGVYDGSGDPQYTIYDNPLFTNGTIDDPFYPDGIQERIGHIKTYINAPGDYNPIQAKFIYDWSLCAGDLIIVRRDGVNYQVPIFQQELVWRGGFVIATVISDGDEIRPVATAPEREDYQLNKRLAECVKTEGNRAYFDEFQISANSSVNVPFGNGQKGLIVLSGGANTKEIVIVNATNAGVVTRVSVTSNSNYTYTTSTRNLNIANGTANAVQGIVLYF